MKTFFTVTAMLCLMMASVGTTSAVSPRGNCSCTEHPPFCDPDKALISAVSNYTTALRKEMVELCTDEEGCHPPS